MTEKIDIAEILKDKPANTKLYSPSFGEVYFSHVGGGNIAVEHHGGISLFFSSGRFFDYDESEPLLFPSKEMRDWRKFAWKKGDVLVNKDGDVHIIFERFADDTYCSFVGKYYLWKENNDTEHFYENERLLTSDFQKAGKDAAQTYISTIEERLGGKLNRETLVVEKPQPEFKDGDIVVTDAAPYSCYSKCIFILKGDLNTNENSANSYVFFNINNNRISFDVLDTTIRDRNIHLATDSEKQQLFDAIEKEGKAWDSDKKQIVDLPKKCEFKVFEKVLVRESKTDEWTPNFFFKIHRDDERYVMVCGDMYNYCIPYNEETAHLLGTTDEWKGGEG